MHTHNLALVRSAIAVIVFVAIASLIMRDSSHAAAAKSSAPPRGYYLTKNLVNGSQAALTDGTVCAAGYHMASLYEIHEPSNLTYNTSLGITFADSGSGPPTDTFGWIRTGTPAGFGNCNAWTDSSSTNIGAEFALTSGWTSAATIISPWTSAGTQTSCNGLAFVWCVQD